MFNLTKETEKKTGQQLTVALTHRLDGETVKHSLRNDVMSAGNDYKKTTLHIANEQQVPETEPITFIVTSKITLH